MKDTKKCEVCGKELPLSDFSKSYKNRCRKCVADMVQSERSEKNKRKDEDVIQPPLRFDMEIRDMSEDFEVLRSVSGVTKVIDWEQRRFDVAKELMKGFATNSHNQCVDASTETLAKWSVGGADALIEELKKERNT